MFLPADSNCPTDFDFFIGEWDVVHRRLRERLVGCTEWDTFTGMNVAKKVMGGFGNVDENGVGTFVANDSLDGKPIVVRFTWSVPSHDRPRWEQAFSPDGGRSWEVNWIMEFSRRTATAQPSFQALGCD